jgi:hypothetical protein
MQRLRPLAIFAAMTAGSWDICPGCWDFVTASFWAFADLVADL